MDITVYLPDELGTEAKAAGLNLSALLRARVTEELDAMKAVKHALSEATEHTIRLRDGEDRPYRGRFEGVLLVEDRGVDVYLVADERLLVHEPDEGRVSQINDPEEELRSWLNDEEYIEVMAAIGREAVVDI